MDYFQLILLAAIAGFTIFLGFPVAAMDIGQKRKDLLNAIAIGIIVFLIIDVFGHAWETASSAVLDALAGKAPLFQGAAPMLAMFLGTAAGLVGLAFFEARNNRKGAVPRAEWESGMAGTTIMLADPVRLSEMIAFGIGAHNLSEGLAIGQSYAAGEIGLALLLIIGFGVHNATEGFGIVGPLSGGGKKPSLSLLLRLGLIGGGPTLVGTLLGSLLVSPLLYVLCLGLAGGALVFVALLMYGVAMRQAPNTTIMLGIFIGIVAGFGSDLLVSIAGA